MPVGKVHPEAGELPEVVGDSAGGTAPEFPRAVCLGGSTRKLAVKLFDSARQRGPVQQSQRRPVFARRPAFAGHRDNVLGKRRIIQAEAGHLIGRKRSPGNGCRDLLPDAEAPDEPQ